MNRIIRVLFPLLAVMCLSWSTAGLAASHREAPQIANDPAADITDVYFFRSWEDDDKVVLLMNVIPGQDPGSGPNYFNFGDDVLYAFHLDIDGDGNADDITYEIRFKTELRGNLAGLKLPLSYVALPPITSLDGKGSDGLILRQSALSQRWGELQHRCNRQQYHPERHLHEVPVPAHAARRTQSPPYRLRGGRCQCMQLNIACGASRPIREA